MSGAAGAVLQGGLQPVRLRSKGQQPGCPLSVCAYRCHVCTLRCKASPSSTPEDFMEQRNASWLPTAPPGAQQRGRTTDHHPFNADHDPHEHSLHA